MYLRNPSIFRLKVLRLEQLLESLLLTIQNHKNVAAVAILKKLSCIVLSKQVQASEEMLNLCSENNIAVFQSSEDSFTTAILLYELLK